MVRTIVFRLRVLTLVFKHSNSLAHIIQDAKRYNLLRNVGLCTDPIPLQKVVKIKDNYFLEPGRADEKAIIQGKGDHLDEQLDEALDAIKTVM